MIVYNNIKQIINLIISKEVAIYGADEIGQLTGKVLEMFEINNYFFVDNDIKMESEKIQGKIIISPSNLENRNKSNTVILITKSGDYNQIYLQLETYGYEFNYNFFFILDLMKLPVYNIKENLCDMYKRNEISNLDCLLFGDSVMSVVDLQDKNRRMLCSMVKDKVSENINILTIHRYAGNMRLFFSVFLALINKQVIPKLIILPVNVRFFSPIIDLDPTFQFVDQIIEIIKDANVDNRILEKYMLAKKITFQDFIDYRYDFGEYKNKKIADIKAWERCDKSNIDIDEKFKIIYSSYYMFKIDICNRNFVLLNQMMKICQEKNIKIILYMNPINSERIVEYTCDSFYYFYKYNFNLIKELTNNYFNCVLFDYSLSFESDCFISKHLDHLNEKGRERMSDIISSIINNGFNEI